MPSSPRLRVKGYRNENGAVALMFAALALILIVLASFAVNIATQVNTKQKLQDQLDGAAQAAAFTMGKGTLCDAVGQARAFYTDGAYQPATPPTPCSAPYDEAKYGKLYIDFWCIVGKDDTNTTPPYTLANQTHIPTMCNPDGRAPFTDASNNPASSNDVPFTVARYPGMTCNATLCAIPCGLLANQGNNFDPQPTTPSSGSRPDNVKPIACNTIRINSTRNVPFSFSDVKFGIKSGTTGGVSSVACVGACGKVATTPINLVVVTDRTGSMSAPDIASMRLGLQNLLKLMNPTYHIVSFGTISRSTGTGTCTSDAAPDSTSGNWLVPGGTNGWSAGYLASNGTLNASDPIVSAVNCFDRGGFSGTWLPAPFKAAAQKLMNPGAVPPSAAGRPNPINVLLFETDGQPHQDLQGATCPGTPPNCTPDASGSYGGTVSINNTDGDPYMPRTHYTSTSVTDPNPTNVPGVPQVPLIGDTCGTSNNGAPASGSYAGTLTPPVSPSTSIAFGSDGKVTTTSGNTVLTVYFCLGNNTDTSTTTTTESRILDGGQQACNQLYSLASQAKASIPNILVVTIGFNLSAHYCGDDNGSTGSSTSSVNNDSPWVLGSEACLQTRKGNASIVKPCAAPQIGTIGMPFPTGTTTTDNSKRLTLINGMGCTTGSSGRCTIWYYKPYNRTRTVTATTTQTVQAAPNEAVLEVLRRSSSPRANGSVGDADCSSAAAIQKNNTDGDWFFCADGSNISTLFGNILQQVAGGVKLLNQP